MAKWSWKPARKRKARLIRRDKMPTLNAHVASNVERIWFGNEPLTPLKNKPTTNNHIEPHFMGTEVGNV